MARNRNGGFTDPPRHSYAHDASIGNPNAPYNRAAIAAMLSHGVLKGRVDQVVAAAQKHRISPAAFAAVIAHESADASSYSARTRNNFTGIMGQSYGSIEKGLDAGARLLRKYVDRGMDTLAKIKPVYAPDGAGNDPTGLNNHWLPGVTANLNKFSAGGLSATASASLAKANKETQGRYTRLVLPARESAALASTASPGALPAHPNTPAPRYVPFAENVLRTTAANAPAAPASEKRFAPMPRQRGEKTSRPRTEKAGRNGYRRRRHRYYNDHGIASRDSTRRASYSLRDNIASGERYPTLEDVAQAMFTPQPPGQSFRSAAAHTYAPDRG